MPPATTTTVVAPAPSAAVSGGHAPAVSGAGDTRSATPASAQAAAAAAAGAGSLSAVVLPQPGGASKCSFVHRRKGAELPRSIKRETDEDDDPVPTPATATAATATAKRARQLKREADDGKPVPTPAVAAAATAAATADVLSAEEKLLEPYLPQEKFELSKPIHDAVVEALGLTELHAAGKEHITPEQVRQFGEYYYGQLANERQKMLRARSPLLTWLRKAQVALAPTARAPPGCFLLPRPAGNAACPRYEQCVQWLGATVEWHGAAQITEAMVAKFEDADRNKDGADGAALASILSRAHTGLEYLVLLREKAAELASLRGQDGATQPAADAGPEKVGKRHRAEADRHRQ